MIIDTQSKPLFLFILKNFYLRAQKNHC